MGSSSSSSSTQKYETNIVNVSDTKILNKSVNSSVANTVVAKASECTASVNQGQNANIGNNATIGGDLEVGEIDQSQTAAVSFSCVQVDSFSNDIANSTKTQYENALKNNFSTDAQDKLSASAAASTKSSMGAGPTSSSSKSNVDYKFNQSTTTNTDIQNIIENSIQNNLSMESVKKCVAQINNNQTIDIGNGSNVGGSIRIGKLSQTQAASLMAECVQKSDDGNKITGAIAAELGITLDNTSSVKKSTEITTSATAETTAGGVGEMFGSIFSGIGSMIGNMLGLGVIGAMAGPISTCCSVCCCCICVLILLYFGFQMMGSGGDGQEGGALKTLSDVTTKTSNVNLFKTTYDGPTYLDKDLIKIVKSLRKS